MTLDEFQIDVKNMFNELKEKMMISLAKGVEAKLDQNIMIAIVNNEIENMTKD